MAIVVSLHGEKWLCDLGFGSYGIRAPICLNTLDMVIKQDFDSFLLSKTIANEYLLKALVDGEWLNQYAFDLSPQDWIDFVPANYLNSTHPDAIFVQKLLIVLHDQMGRRILVGDTLKTVKNGHVSKEIIAKKDLVSILHDQFGLAYAT